MTQLQTSPLWTHLKIDYVQYSILACKICKEKNKQKKQNNNKSIYRSKYNHVQWPGAIGSKMYYINLKLKLEAQVGQKSLLWIRLIMIYYIAPWWSSWSSIRLPSAFLYLHVVLMSPIKFLNSSICLKMMLVSTIFDNGRTILEVLYLHVTTMHSTMFQLKLIYAFGGDASH